MTTTTTNHVKRAKRYLGKLGLSLPKNPGYNGSLVLDDDPSALTPAQLTTQMAKWSRQLEYLKSQLALAEISHRNKEERYKKLTTMRFISLREANPDSSVTDLRAQVETSLPIQQLADKIAVADAKRRLLEALHESADQNYRLLSRELTRRTHTQDRDLDP